MHKESDTGLDMLNITMADAVYISVWATTGHQENVSLNVLKIHFPSSCYNVYNMNNIPQTQYP